ncbi:hypothetical protein QGN32_12135 [Mycolicibacterium sp. ND9-15]|uniref:hypothetical protein n=1 Tax=Mycolicibacterium sp. ND9-15 TaxID=3042320 RepID=UPI002DDA845F|nr:hypothetical protein [Mycolicibacterium sp. ND9-15]WSE58540.1 hypothetical protein QGN32_12135 [Mycolicibacterium sp. ND9-15]
MTTNTTRRVARHFALPIVAAGIVAGALGFAGAANAGTYSPDNTPRPGIVAAPSHTAPSGQSGSRGHRVDHLQIVQPSWHP